MNSPCTLVLLVLVAFRASFSVSGKEPPPHRPTAEAAAQQLARDWEAAWNRHDAAALASLLDENADFITVRGPDGWLKGRRQLQDDHAEKHKTRFAQSVWKTTRVHVKFLRPDLALA